MLEASRFQFTDAAVPRTYDDFLVPRMFEPWGGLLPVSPVQRGDPAELLGAVSAAGLRGVQAQTWRLPLSVEGGVEQVVRGCIGASPLAPGVAELPEERRAALMDAARKHLTGLITGFAVRGDMVANVVLAHV